MLNQNLRKSMAHIFYFSPNFKNRNWKHRHTKNISTLSLSGLLSFKSGRLFLLALIVSLLLLRLRFWPIVYSRFSFLPHVPLSFSQKLTHSLSSYLLSCITKSLQFLWLAELSKQCTTYVVIGVRHCVLFFGSLETFVCGYIDSSCWIWTLITKFFVYFWR